MKFGLALSIFLAVLLIGGVSWQRFDSGRRIQYDLVSVNNAASAEGDSYYQEFLNDFLKTKEETGVSNAKPLTETDIIGRRLILDYVELAGNGQATEANLNNLANRYVASITNFHNSERLTIKDLKLTTDSLTSYENYSDKFIEIYTKRGERLNSLSVSIDTKGTTSSAYAKFSKSASIIYRDTSLLLQNLPVPSSLAELHLELINNQLSTAAGFEALNKTDEDPIKALAGLAAVRENLDKEAVIFKKMEKISVDI